MHTSYDMYLRCATTLSAADNIQHLIHRVVPRTRLARLATIGAELTLEEADISRLEVEITVIVDLLPADPALGCKGEFGELPQRRLLPEDKSLLGSDTLCATTFFDNICE